ncbi:MAG: TonB-dependent receptor [Thermomonas sp.]
MQHKQLQPKPLALALLAAMISMAAMPTLAQDSATQDAKQEAKTLDTIVVTAQKREEALQDVPITINVLSQEALQDAGVHDIKDLQVLVPGLTVTSTQSEAITTARIRGIGTVGDNVGLESSVGVVIDGVYRPRNSVGFGDLGELQRIEVLKGPQGTVFGKNTSAGVINIVTKRPSFVRGGDAEFTLGTPGAIGFSGSFNTPVGENNAFRIYAAKRSRDGFMNVRTGAGPRLNRADADQDYHTVRAQWLFTNNDNFDINFAADYTKRDENCCAAVTLVRGAPSPLIDALAGGAGLAPVADPFARVAYSNRDTTQKIEEKGVSAEANWTTPWLGGATLTSITAARDWNVVNGLDFDYSAADILYRQGTKDESFAGFKQFSQELRLTGATENLDWMVGMFYADEDLDRNESYRFGSAYEPYLSTLVGQKVLAGVQAKLPPGWVNQANPATFLSQVSGKPYGTNYTGLGALDNYKQNAKSLALFTNNTWHATEALDLTLGLRYTQENKTLDSRYRNPNGSIGCGNTLANPGGRVGAALAARIPNFGLLPPATQAALIGAVAPDIVGFMCLPWANALHNGRSTHQERDESEWTGTLKAAYRWNPQVMTYASAARGYKAGGFNLDRVQSSNGLSSGGAGIAPVNDTSFPGEFVDSYELGAKTTWAGGNLLLNATLFHQTFSDFQLNSFLGTSFVVRSIPEVTSRGVDTEIQWKLAAIEGLMLQGGLTYAKTENGNSIPGCDFVGPGQTTAACPSIGALYKLPGSQVSFAPEVSASAAVTYEWALDEGVLARFNIGAKYMSEFNTGSDLDVEKQQSAYTVVNARIGVGPSDRSWSVELWALNIFDTEYVQVGFDGPLQAVGTPLPNAQHTAADPLNTYNGFLGAPATYGVTFRKRF